MARPVILSAARADLVEIGDFIATDNPARALSFVAEIEARIGKLAEMPGASLGRDELHSGLRSVRHGRYTIFFMELGDEVHVVRVIHTSRELGPMFGG